jgi:hypothetical protein
MILALSFHIPRGVFAGSNLTSAAAIPDAVLGYPTRHAGSGNGNDPRGTIADTPKGMFETREGLDPTVATSTLTPRTFEQAAAST